ncbi:MAG: zf-TFIIB domain-containing protein [Planctomycetes bacterium]|nr:zf-TFIIB domain-containing protein [Planctomycetota bacterium]
MDKKLKCPTCDDAELALTRLEGAKVWRCKICDGSWLGDKELAYLRMVKYKRYDPKEIVKVKLLREWKMTDGSMPPERLCPVCGELMARSHYEDIPAILQDRCAKGHGIWLNRGDLERIQINERAKEDKWWN